MGGKRIRVLALTDCSYAYDTVGSVSVNSAEMSMRILIAYVRDSLISICFSFVGATFNLADVATKNGGIRGIYDRFIKTGNFIVSFAGRSSAKNIADAQVQK